MVCVQGTHVHSKRLARIQYASFVGGFSAACFRAILCSQMADVVGQRVDAVHDANGPFARCVVMERIDLRACVAVQGRDGGASEQMPKINLT